MKTTNISYTIDERIKGNYKISISLNDDCKNGHEDFSITGTFWETGKARTDKNMITAGCCHDEILKVRPDLKMFTDLHLSDNNGIPTYALENGFYHRNDRETFKNYLRLTEVETDLLIKAEDETHLYLLLRDNNIITRWKAEANKAIEWLEDKTGKTFKSKATRSQLNTPSEGDIAKAEERQKEGYYTPELIAKRENKRKKQAIAENIKKVKQEAAKEIVKINNALKVKLELLRILGNCENTIYYDHTNTLKFNWLDYEGKYTKEDVEKFKALADYSKLPVGIKIEIT